MLLLISYDREWLMRLASTTQSVGLRFLCTQALQNLPCRPPFHFSRRHLPVGLKISLRNCIQNHWTVPVSPPAQCQKIKLPQVECSSYNSSAQTLDCLWVQPCFSSHNACLLPSQSLYSKVSWMFSSLNASPDFGHVLSKVTSKLFLDILFPTTRYAVDHHQNSVNTLIPSLYVSSVHIF